MDRRHGMAIGPSATAVELRFQNIHYSLEVSKMKAFFMGGKPGVKHILKNVSGAVASGQILAIIGSSGAGKTSLLNVLVGKTSGDTKGVDITGDVTVNGKASSRSFLLDNAAYVPQEDHLWSALTVRESLMYACTMYSPSMSGAECSQRVDEALASLGLEACQHTKVGSVFIKGISGGQKRRTSIGLELVIQRKILFLDEPTSGLDATSASEIMALLRRLASETGVIIITSVHQPSSRVFENFDQVILLTMGRTAYFGPAVDGLEHFRRLGHEPTGLVNPAEYLLEITNSDFSDAADVKRLTELWSESPACEALNKRLQAPFLPPVTSRRNTGCIDSVRRLGQLVSRASLSSIRDPAAYALRLVLYVGMSLFLGNVYSRLENTQEDVLERAFFILWINAFNPYMDLAALPLFGQEKSVVMKEVQNGQYGAASFCIANAVVQAPFVLLISLCCTAPAYWMTGMNDDPARYFQFVMVIFLMLYVMESLAQLVGVVFENMILGIAAFATLLSIFFLFNGFFIDPDHLPVFWLGLYWISPLRYSWEMLAKIVFDGQTFSGMDTCFACYGATGDQVLDSLSNGGTNLNDVSIVHWCCALAGMSLVWRMVHYLALKRFMF